MRFDRRSWGRLRQIGEVLAHHGLLMVSDHIGLSSYLSLGHKIRSKQLPSIDADWPERVRLVLADLGPTYVKLGQLASIRPDILPEPLIRSLEHLQDDVPPFSYQEVMEIIETAWGVSLTDYLDWIDPEPLAAASIGQVHRARLSDGRPVVIKVRRPGIDSQAEKDFRLLRIIADKAEQRVSWAKEAGVKDLVEELVMTMRDELDFSVEAQNTETARKNLAHSPDIRVPQVIWALTRSNVLVMESLTGVKINDANALDAMGLSRADVAHRYVHTLYQQIFLQGFFHADPHPGNVHVDNEGHLMLLDWGLVGMLSQEMRNRAVALVLGLVRGRSEDVADALVAISSTSSHVDRPALVRSVERLRRRYYETRLEDFRLGQAMADIFQVAQHYHLRVPPEYLLLAKTAVTADGVVRGLDPSFSLLAMGQPLAGELLWNRINPQNWVSEAARGAIRLGSDLTQIPGELERALRTLSRGEIRIVLEHKNIDRILSHWEKLVDRLAMALLLGAIVLGLALVVHRNHLERLAGVPIGDYAFVITVALGIWAVIGALRRGKL